MEVISETKVSADSLNHIFKWRKKTCSYKRIPSKIKKQLLDEFSKNQYPNKEDLEEIAKNIQIPLPQVQNWFKYQRKNEYQTNKNSLLKNYRIKHKFEKNEKLLLEKYFREKNYLNENTLTLLEKKLKCKGVFIKRWFYYRNQKLRALEELKSQETLKQANTFSSVSTSVVSSLSSQMNSPINYPQNFQNIANPGKTNLQNINSPQYLGNNSNNYPFLNQLYDGFKMPSLNPYIPPVNLQSLYLQNAAMMARYPIISPNYLQIPPMQYYQNPVLPYF